MIGNLTSIRKEERLSQLRSISIVVTSMNLKDLRPVKTIALLSVLILPSLNVYSAQYFVDNLIGSDNNSGMSTSPWASLKKAANSARAGDTIFIVRNKNHPYQYPLVPKLSGTPKNLITFRGVNPLSKPIFTAGGNKTIINVDTKSHLRFKDLILQNTTEQGIVLNKSNNIVLDGLEIYQVKKNGVLVIGGGDIAVSNCTIKSIGNSGIALIGSKSNKLHDTLIEKCNISYIMTNDGITLHKDGSGNDVGSEHIIRLNTISHCNEQGIDITSGNKIYLQKNHTFNNGQSGLMVSHGAKNVIITNHQSNNENKYGVLILNSSNVELSDSNIYWSGTHPELKIRGTRNLKVSNNRIVGDGPSSIIDIEEESTGVYFVDNIILSLPYHKGPLFRMLKLSFSESNHEITWHRNNWFASDKNKTRFVDKEGKHIFSRFILSTVDDKIVLY
jgi:hypothetical protein